MGGLTPLQTMATEKKKSIKNGLEPYNYGHFCLKGLSH